MGKRKINEEFYNIARDPECLNNLAEHPEFNELKQKMKARMEKMLKEQKDPRMFGNGDIFNSYKFSEEKGNNYYDRFMKGDFNIHDTGWVNPGDCEKAPLD
jgi:hypothetical protein